MKKAIIILMAAMVSAVSANAQRINYSVEGAGGKGSSVGVEWKGGAAVLASYEISPAMSIGVGAGVDYASSLYGHVSYTDKRSGDTFNINKDYFHRELLVPIFVRAKYVFTGVNFMPDGKLNPYLAIDGGYTLNALSMDPDDGVNDYVPESNQFLNTAKGVFYTPQVGLDSDKFYLSVGLNCQRFTERYSTRIVSLSPNLEGEQVFDSANHGLNFAQALVFRLGIKF